MANIVSSERQARGAGPGLSYWLGTKVLSQALAIEPMLYARLQMAVKEGVFDPAISLGPIASKFVGQRAGESGYRVTDDGIAIVPVSGLLIDRGAYLGDVGGWLTTYEGIVEQCRRIRKDTAIHSVLLDIDSGGGMVAGMLEVAEALADLRKSKRLYGIANNMAASAAYAIGCVPDELYVTSQGLVGSIGIITTHMSYADMLAQAGIEATIIHAGARKADGNPYQPLSHIARADRSAEIDFAYDAFASHVARERDISADAVKATEARSYVGTKAVAAKLADGVKSFDEVLEHIRASKAKGGRPRGPGKTKTPASASLTPATPKGDPGMSGNTQSGEQPDLQALITAGIAQLAASRQAPAPVAVPAAAVTPAAVAPAAAEDASARIFAILDSDEGKKRPTLARTLAGSAKLSADEAKAILAASAEETAAAAPVNPLAAAMRAAGTSAGIKPDAAAAAAAATGAGGKAAALGLPSLADSIAAKYPAACKRRNRS